MLAQLAHQAQDLRGDGHVERLGDVVGDEEGRIADQRIDDQRALHHAAAELRGKFVEARLRRRECAPRRGGR